MFKKIDSVNQYHLNYLTALHLTIDRNCYTLLVYQFRNRNWCKIPHISDVCSTQVVLYVLGRPRPSRGRGGVPIPYCGRPGSRFSRPAGYACPSCKNYRRSTCHCQSCEYKMYSTVNFNLLNVSLETRTSAIKTSIVNVV